MTWHSAGLLVALLAQYQVCYWLWEGHLFEPVVSICILHHQIEIISIQSASAHTYVGGAARTEVHHPKYQSYKLWYRLAHSWEKSHCEEILSISVCEKLWLTCSMLISDTDTMIASRSAAVSNTSSLEKTLASWVVIANNLANSEGLSVCCGEQHTSLNPPQKSCFNISMWYSLVKVRTALIWSHEIDSLHRMHPPTVHHCYSFLHNFVWPSGLAVRSSWVIHRDKTLSPFHRFLFLATQ